MSESLVLVDSSIWIAHLIHPTSASIALDHLVTTQRAAINAVIRLELLTGARDETQYAELEETLQGLHALPVSDVVWKRAERLRFELRKSGHLIPVPDVLIAASALVYRCELFHLDRHFDLIARSTPLRLHRPEPT